LRGAATLESLLALVVVLLPLLGALFELTQLGIGRQLLQAAAFDAARAAAVAQGDRDVLRRVLARGLVTLHGTAPATPPAIAFGRALVDTRRPDFTRIEILSPSRAAFDDHAVAVDGDRWLPNAGSELIAGRGARSGLSLAEANSLVVRVRYCQRLVVPLLDRMIAGVWQRFGSPEARACLQQRRVPVVVEARTVMQSPASAARMGLR